MALLELSVLMRPVTHASARTAWRVSALAGHRAIRSRRHPIFAAAPEGGQSPYAANVRRIGAGCMTRRKSLKRICAAIFAHFRRRV